MEKLSTLQDKELVELFKEGSKQAFEALYLRYKKKLMYFCNRLLRDETRAEDIVHDVFLQIFDTFDALNPEKDFFGYLQTIAKNRILDEFKKYDVHLRYAKEININENEAINQTENLILDNDYAKLLKKVIDRLSPKQKEVFRLSRIYGLTHKEIAERLHISLPTVKEHATLALKKIRKQLAKHADIHFKTVNSGKTNIH